MQTLRLVRAPQAFRLALAPMTNDFVALLKDSSLVSMLTVVELTKQTQIFATNIGSWVIPGLLCALLYLAMSLPLGYLARRLEERWRMPTRMTRALEATGVRLKRGSREILRGVDLHADAGELVALMGLSGSGKTTMLRVIAGLEPRDAGEVSAAKVGMVFQFHYLFEHLCAIDNVTLAPTEVLRHPDRATPGSARSSCSISSASAIAPTRCRASCRAVKRSASRSRARWRSIRRCCCSTSRPRRSIPRAETISARRCCSSRSRAARSS